MSPRGRLRVPRPTGLLRKTMAPGRLSKKRNDPRKADLAKRLENKLIHQPISYQ